MRETQLERPSHLERRSPPECDLRRSRGSKAHGLLWSLAVSVFAQAGGFAMNFLLARALGRSAFGEWATVQSTVGTVSGMAQLSMSITAMKFVAQYRDSRRDRVGTILGLCSTVTATTGLLASGLLFASAPWLASSILRLPTLNVPIRISVATLFFLTITGYQAGALNGLERFRTLAFLGAAQSGAAALLSPLLAGTWGVRGALTGYGAALLLAWYLHRRFLNRALTEAGIQIRFAGMKREAGVLADFAVPATLSGVIGMLAVWISTVVLVRGASGYSEMASLAVATTLRTAVLFAPNVIARVSGPVLTNLIGRSVGDYRRTFRLNLLVTFWSAVGLAVPVALFAPTLLSLFGREFRGTGAVVAIMAASGVMEAVSIALSQQFLSHTLMWSNLAVVTARSGALVVATLCLVPGHAALGAAYASFISYVVHVVLAYALIRWGNRKVRVAQMA